MEYREIVKLVAVLRHFRPITIPPKDQMSDFQKRNFPKYQEMSIESLMGQITPVFTMKNEFDNRDESIMKSTFGKFQTIRTLMKGTESAVFQSMGSLKVERF